ncbi:MAG TPA: branched-chain amino acid aminotransferase [Polyangiaceae bacterium]|nr:branched-chain amino acid aminotransferase [Polyangiaceae bacterium]
MTTGSTIDLRPKAQSLGDAERAKLLEGLGFGRVFTEHMVKIAWREPNGWQRGELVPYAPLTLDPASSVLHYGQAIFEGFKAYRQANGGIATFRPEANARRFNQSAARMAMPALPVERFVEAADVLIRMEEKWVPSGAGESMYLRPLAIATEAALGVRPAKEYLFIVFGSPSGQYFPQGVKPVSVWLCKDYVRAAPGGTGEAKCAGNYAASLVAQQKAIDAGCQQVVWLDAAKHENVEEMGGMNLFFVYQKHGKTTLVTPALTGALLPGITRDSILTLANDLGYEKEERVVSVTDWGRDLENGTLTEVFACGTAAVITPVGQVKFDGGSWTIHGGESGPVATRIRNALLDIQYGRTADKYGWMHRVA